MGLQRLEPPSAERPYKDSLRDLGYEVAVYEAGRYEAAKYPEMTFYAIREPNTYTDIGRLAACADPVTRMKETELVILEINTSVDRRLGRPRAHDILAGFWERTLQRDISDLRRLYFDTVTEHKTVNVVKHHVCPLMQVAWQWHHRAPQADITLRNPDLDLVQTNTDQREAWDLLHDESKLVRLARSILSANTQMAYRGERFHTTRLDIIPQPDGAGEFFAFDLQVEFGV